VTASLRRGPLTETLGCFPTFPRQPEPQSYSQRLGTTPSALMSRQACPGRHPKSKDKAEKILRGWFAEVHSWKFLDKLEKGLLL
jgi:hypothetical protein